MWDLIHDRTHMRGDLPFDPFMIKQRMPFFLYSLEEVRCDLTAFREAVRLVRDETTDATTRDQARPLQYAVLFDRMFRFPLTGSRVRNYDGLGGQLLFAWLHQRHVLHWTDTALAFDWADVPDVVVRSPTRSTSCTGAASTGRRSRTGSRPTTWFATLSSRIRRRPGPWSFRRGADRAAAGDDGRRARRRVPAVDVRRGPGKKMSDVIASTEGITGSAA